MFAVSIMVLDAFLTEGVLIDFVPWPAVLPVETRSVVFLFGLVLLGAVAHAVWWILGYWWRRRICRQDTAS